MEVFLNKLYYSFFLFAVKLHFLFNKVCPFFLLFRIPYFKKKFKRKKYNPIEEFNRMWNNKETGFNLRIADFYLMAVIFLPLLSVTLLLFKIALESDIAATLDYKIFIAVGALSFFICYHYIYKGDKYLLYFKKYEKWDSKKSTKWMIISFLLVALSIIIFFQSMLF